MKYSRLRLGCEVSAFFIRQPLQGNGPATPQEIIEALKAGGYKFEAKSDEIALIGLRALLRKATSVFHKLPGTRAYGLMAWYPGAKPGNDSDEKPKKGRRSKRATKPPRKAKAAASGTKSEQPSEAQDA